MRHLSPLAISLLVLVGLTLAGLWAYGGGGIPLTAGEVSAYMARIESQTQQPGARHNLAELRQFLDGDDGRPVYTVNLYEFHDDADYPPGSGFDGTGPVAYARFSEVMIPLMLTRGSHPVFSTSWADTADDGWDRIVIVRYRSRRDLADLFATDAFAEASLHKWASLRRHDRLLVQGVHLPGGEVVILLLTLLGASVILLVFRRR